MSLLDIVKIGSSKEEVLYNIAKPILEIEDRHIKLANDMIETMIDANGIGLAANQIDSLERIIIVVKETYEGSSPLVMINPEIISFSNKMDDTYVEGCLSIPDKKGNVNRYEEIMVKYLTLKGKELIQDFYGLTARIIQHEIDHLDGILFTSKATNLKNRVRND